MLKCSCCGHDKFQRLTRKFQWANTPYLEVEGDEVISVSESLGVMPAGGKGIVRCDKCKKHFYVNCSGDGYRFLV